MIHQYALFHMVNFETVKEVSYSLKKEGNGVYAFVIEGEVEIEGQTLGKRDGLGLWNTSEIRVKSNTPSKILLIEIPLTL